MSPAETRLRDSAELVLPAESAWRIKGPEALHTRVGRPVVERTFEVPPSEAVATLRRAVRRWLWRLHERLTAVMRRSSARILALCYLAALLRASALITSGDAIALVFVGTGTALFLVSARVLALVSVLGFGGAAAAYVLGSVATTERFVTDAYYVFLLLVGQQCLVYFLGRRSLGAHLRALVVRIEALHYRAWQRTIVDAVVGLVALVRNVKRALGETVSRGEESVEVFWRALARWALLLVHAALWGAVGLYTVVGGTARSTLRLTQRLATRWHQVSWSVVAILVAAVLDLLRLVGRTTGIVYRLQKSSISSLSSARSVSLPWFPALLTLLIVSPWFWFRAGEGDFGGDSSRLYFVDPLAWLRTQALHEIGTDGFGTNNPTYFTIPFLLLLQGVKLLLFNRAALLLPVFNSVLLVTAFLSVYALLRDLLDEDDLDKARVAACCGALFFVFSQIVMYQWQRSLYTFHQIAVYPLLLWLFLRYLKRPRLSWLLLAVLWTVVFSVNFSAFAAPNLFAFFPFAGLLLLVWAWARGLRRRFFRGVGIFFLLVLPAHAFHLVPQAVSLTNPQNALVTNLVSPEGKFARGRAYFESVRPMVRLVYNLVGFNQYELYTKTGVSPELLRLQAMYGVNFLPAFFLFPLVVLWGVVLAGRDPRRRTAALFFTTMLLWFVLLFLMTANLFGTAGPNFYARLFVVPGFAMFRSFYGVFAISFAFFYALSIGLALSFVLRRLTRSLFRPVLVSALALLLLVNAVPFLRGRIVNSVLADTTSVKMSSRFPFAFTDTLRWVRDLSLDAKVLTLPLTQFNYQIVGGEGGGAYVGASPVGILSGKHTISGLGGFDGPGTSVISSGNAHALFRQTDPRVIRRFLAMLNIGFVFFNTSPDVYRDRFTGWPYSKEVWGLFPTTQDIQRFVDHLDYPRVFTAAPYEIYHAPADAFLPHLYVPKEVREGRTLASVFGILLNNPDGELRMAVALNPDTETSALLNGPYDVSSSLEWKKMSSSEYVLVVHGIKGNTPVVFNELFHRGWRLFPRVVGSSRCGDVRPAASVSGQPGHANLADVAAWCDGGLLSASGPDFISQNVADSIQNQNLPAEKPWKRWGATAITDRYHVRVNGYANIWWLDLAYLKQQFPASLRERPDGSYDLTLALEFTPERSFFVGSAVSGVVLIGTLAALGVTVLRLRGRLSSR